jgi:hypothetical protein
MKKKKSWNFGFKKNKKAIIFTLDVAVALVVVFSLLFTASFFVVRKSQDPYPTLQLMRTGSDMVRVMEYKGYFNNPDETTITNYLNDNLPPNYEMYIEGSSGSPCFFQAGTTPPEDKPIVSGKEFFAINGDYCSARYKLWLR